MRAAQLTHELRAAANPLQYVPAVRDLVRRADDRVPLSEVKSQSAWIDETINQEIVFARLSTAFAILALAIACVGLYGTMSYPVARRTGEIGIRMALGAQRGRVVWMVLREVVILAAVGLAISLPAALTASRVVESFLFRETGRSAGVGRIGSDPGACGPSGRLSDPKSPLFDGRSHVALCASGEGAANRS